MNRGDDEIQTKRRGSRYGITRDEYLRHAALYAERGNALPHSRLDAETVRAIRANVKGLTARQWAETLGVHIRTIEKVQRFETWVHVA